MREKRYLAWRNAPLAWRKAFKNVSIAIILSLGIMALLYLGAYWIFGVSPFPVTGERISLFLDAILAGIIAFALLGAFAFVASTRDPAQDKIDDRISYLYSAEVDGLGDAERRYLKEQLLLLGATVTKATQSITFLELSPNGQFARSTTMVSMQICNMMKHDEYRQKLPLLIALEDMPTLHCDPGIVHYIRTTSQDGYGTRGETREQLPTPVRLTRTSPSLDVKIDIEIPPSGKLDYQYLFESWGPLEEPNVCGANRYAQAFEVAFMNLTDHAIDLLPLALEKRELKRTLDAPCRLEPNDSESFVFFALPPAENIGIVSKVC